MLARQHSADHLFLHAAEAIEAEDAFEDVVGVGHWSLNWRAEVGEPPCALASLGGLRNLLGKLRFRLPLPQLGIESAKL